MSGLAPNSRSRRVEESATLAISAEANRLKAAGHDVVSLGAGEPDFPAPPPVARAGVEAIEQHNYRYTATSGVPALREAGAAWLRETFGLDHGADEVMVTAGAKGALHMALETILEPGDRVLVLAPYWVSYPALISMAGGAAVVVDAMPERGFVHDAETIARAAEEHGAKGVIFNSPNNPSGAVASRQDVQALVDLCKARGMWIISDEIYATLLYDGAEHVSPAALPGGRERTVVVNGFTKSHTMTGWRTSFMAAPEEIIRAAGRVQSQLLGNPCTISQAAMLAACRRSAPEEQQRRMEAFTARRAFLIDAIGQIDGLSLAPPMGAFYALMDARSLCEQRGFDDFEACRQLLDQQRLALVPGSAFAAPGFLRASYAASTETLREAVARLRRWAEGA